MSGLPVEFEPGLAEDAILAALRGRHEAAAFHAEREAAYAAPDPEEREAHFRALHARWFERLDLGAVIAEALGEQPSLVVHAARCVVLGARSRHEEGAELCVAALAEVPEASHRTAVIRLRPETLADSGRARALLRRELLYLADMLDPAFGYSPRTLAPSGGALPEPLFRRRYGVLWDARVDGRRRRLGWALPGIRDERWHDFVATFPMLGDRAEAAFERFFDGGALTHADLAAFAAAPEAALDRPPRGGARSDER